MSPTAGISCLIRFRQRYFEKAEICTNRKCCSATGSKTSRKGGEREIREGVWPMSSEVGWEFPIDAADQWQGFNDPGIEHFRGNPIGSLAREMIQNSLDAPSGSPVSVSFQLRDVPIKEIPNIDQLKYTIQ